MKKFYEINSFTQIEVSTNYCALKSLLYEVNGIIYKYRLAYAFPILVNAAKEELTAKFKQMAELEIKSTKHSNHAKPREEILQYGRNIIKALSEHNQAFKFDNSCVEAITTSARFQVRAFLQAKDKMTITDGEEMMRRNAMLYNTIKTVEQECNTKIFVPKFIQLQGDIKNLINKKLDAYDFAA